MFVLCSHSAQNTRITVCSVACDRYQPQNHLRSCPKTFTSAPPASEAETITRCTTIPLHIHREVERICGQLPQKTTGSPRIEERLVVHAKFVNAPSSARHLRKSNSRTHVFKRLNWLSPVSINSASLPILRRRSFCSAMVKSVCSHRRLKPTDIGISVSELC